MPVFIRSLALLTLCVVLLAGCGGSSDDVAPEATPEPTLTTEERIEFTPGTIENPIQMVIRPVQRVFVELQMVLADITGISATEITRASVLRDELMLAETLPELTAPLTETFAVSLTNATEIITVGDLELFVQTQLADQIAQTLFDRTSIHFEVPIADRFGTGLDALCGSNLGIVSMAWLDGITYAAAIERGCGEPALQVSVFDTVYDVGLLADVALDEVLIETTPEVTAEATGEVTPESDEVASTPTETPLPTDTPTPQPTETPIADAESTPEATPEALPDVPGRAGTPALFLVDRNLGTTRVDVVLGRTYCRLGIDDYFSWLTATLIMRQNNIDPQNDILEILDISPESALVQAVAEGRCTATVLSEDTFEALSDVLDDDVLDNLLIAETTPAYPYAILVYPFEVQLGVRLNLNEEFIALSTDDETGAPLRWLLGQDVIVDATEASFAPFIAYLETTGLNFGQLGE